MRVAALDLGKARVGLAVSDELGALAHPRPALDARDRASLLRALATLAREEPIDTFVLGVALDREGDVGPQARRALAFGEALRAHTGCVVELFDERLTSVQAGRLLREAGRNARRSRARIDSAAACVMLQAWLDARRPREP
jgi:putative Holliday junction resolvase